MSNDTQTSAQVAEVHRRLESIKETHKARLFEDVPEDAIGVLTQSEDSKVVDLCDELLETIPQPEPNEVRKYRSLVIAIDTVRDSDEFPANYDDTYLLQNLAVEYREKALGLIENRLVLETPTEEGDADVFYIFDPVSKVRHTTALGGYKKEYDEARIEDEKYRLASQILTDPIPDTIPRV